MLTTWRVSRSAQNAILRRRLGGGQYLRAISATTGTFEGPACLSPSFTELCADATAEGDSVLLKRTNDPASSSIFIRKLRASDGVFQSHFGVIHHRNLIGKRARDIVKTNKEKAYWISEPTLEEYVLLTTRLCTPVRARLEAFVPQLC